MLHDTEARALTVVTDDTFASTVLASDRPVVVDFWAQWCPPCRAISQSLVELAAEFGDRMAVATLNIDENPATARAYGVMSLPTLLVFRDGDVVGSVVGSRPKAHLRSALGKHAEPVTG
ncbi:thioredoxin [Polymorphospora rubra]|uniref:Thioredoxin n=1 Tax=Polymorphospora rubra TaxID=338584 RepID=A0A810N063_9ACTN|nr:thioredoxin [Polymorphospora rubra]BCJ65609.1 thioredoxin-1 [Polymorphospora rubra]